MKNLLRFRLGKATCYSFVALLFLALACDGRLHWDEPSYLYTGGYMSFSEILKGEFQPSGIEGLYLSRIFHILFVYGITRIIGLGLPALSVISLLYLFLLFAFLYVSYLILRELLPETPRLGLAILCGAFTPIYLYLAFKTLPEIPALLLAAVAAHALLRSFHGNHTMWLLLVVLSLAGMAFFKNTAALLYISLVVALFLFRPDQYPRGKLLKHVLVSGLGSLAVFTFVLLSMGIDVSAYFAIGLRLQEWDEPFIVTLLNIALEGGGFFLAIPLAFVSRRREALFLTTWFLLATVPLPLIYNHIESRYLATNFISLCGLIYLTIENLRPYVIRWWRRSRVGSVAVGALGCAALTVSNLAALSVVPHEVRMDQLHVLLMRLDQRYGRSNYAILVPESYTDFHYLRFVYPHRQVYCVQSIFRRSQNFWGGRHTFEEKFYPNRVLRTLEQLAPINTTLIYLGYKENHSVANLRSLVRIIPALHLERQFEKMNFLNHLSRSWMWENRHLIFSEPIRNGHYFAYEVKVARP